MPGAVGPPVPLRATPQEGLHVVQEAPRRGPSESPRGGLGPLVRGGVAGHGRPGSPDSAVEAAWRTADSSAPTWPAICWSAGPCNLAQQGSRMDDHGGSPLTWGIGLLLPALDSATPKLPQLFPSGSPLTRFRYNPPPSELPPCRIRGVPGPAATGRHPPTQRTMDHSPGSASSWSPASDWETMAHRRRDPWTLGIPHEVAGGCRPTRTPGLLFEYARRGRSRGPPGDHRPGRVGAAPPPQGGGLPHRAFRPGVPVQFEALNGGCGKKTPSPPPSLHLSRCPPGSRCPDAGPSVGPGAHQCGPLWPPGSSGSPMGRPKGAGEGVPGGADPGGLLADPDPRKPCPPADG